MKKLKKYTTALLCIVLTAAIFSACGSGVVFDNSDINDEKDTNTMENIEGIDVNMISNGFFSVTVPDSWEGKYVSIIDDESIQLYQKAAYESLGGGWLCSFKVYYDESYKELPSYDVLISGAKTDAETNQVLEKHKYIVIYPTDVQADIEDEESTAEYFEMFDQLPQVVKSFVLED